MKLSIITVCRNNAAGLQATLESTLRSQHGFDDWEQIVVDGASDDGSADVLAGFHGDPRMGWSVSEPDGGIYNAMNKGASHARGDFLLFLNSGDLLLPEILRRVFSEEWDADIAYGELIVRNAKGKDKVKVYPPPEELRPVRFLDDSLPHPASFISRALFERYGGYDETYRIVSDGIFFLDAVSTPGVRFHRFPFAISIFMREGISTSPKSKALYEEELRRWLVPVFGEHVVWLARQAGPFAFIAPWPVRRDILRDPEAKRQYLYALNVFQTLRGSRIGRFLLRRGVAREDRLIRRNKARKGRPRLSDRLFAMLPESLRLALSTIAVRRRYRKVLARIRRKPAGEKLRVLFCVGEPAKWKCQRLFEKMAESGIFEPVVCLTAWNGQAANFIDDEKLARQHREAEAFFDGLGDAHVRAYKKNSKGSFDLAKFKPDLVFYSEPYAPARVQTPPFASRSALTFYIPYFVPSHGDIQIEGHQPLHRFLYAYFTLNGWWAEAFDKSWPKFDHTTRFVATGHPSLDFFAGHGGGEMGDGPVVFAPHYSFPHPKNHFAFPFSTFLWSGRQVLEYAQAHPGLGWVYKPHPLLREYLLRTGMMSEAEVDAYWAAWAAVGQVCEDGAYQDLFIRSRALVTDSCTFLMEYGATGKPVIHLKRHDTGVTPVPPARAVFDAYYQVYDEESLAQAFSDLFEPGGRGDWMREKRLAAVRSAGVVDSDASGKIIAYLRDLLKK